MLQLFKKLDHWFLSYRLAIAAFIALSFTGCVIYHLDPNAEHAQVIAKDYMMFTNQNEMIISDDDYLTCRSLYYLDSQGKPFNINANHFTTLIVSHILGYDTLNFAFTFVPKANHIY